MVQGALELLSRPPTQVHHRRDVGALHFTQHLVYIQPLLPARAGMCQVVVRIHRPGNSARATRCVGVTSSGCGRNF